MFDGCGTSFYVTPFGHQLSAMHITTDFFNLRGITPNSSVTTKAFARRFVDDRSRVLHGTVSTLNVRMADSRDSLENLVTTLVRATVQELDLYLQSPSPVDDRDAFLSWIKARRRQARATPTA
jgi:hypothetical protein